MLLLSERLTLQGFPASTAQHINPNLILKAAGNTYPVPLLMAELWPILHSIAVCGNLPDHKDYKRPEAHLLPDWSAEAPREIANIGLSIYM
eukprot:10555396-Karenia_brevis.AAC.1